MSAHSDDFCKKNTKYLSLKYFCVLNEGRLSNLILMSHQISSIFRLKIISLCKNITLSLFILQIKFSQKILIDNIAIFGKITTSFNSSQVYYWRAVAVLLVFKHDRNCKIAYYA